MLHLTAEPPVLHGLIDPTASFLPTPSIRRAGPRCQPNVVRGSKRVESAPEHSAVSLDALGEASPHRGKPVMRALLTDTDE